MEINTAAEADQVKNLTIGEKLKYFFTNPNKIFEDYKTKPTWGIKVLLVIAIAAIVGYLTMVLTADAQLDLIMQQAPDITKEQAQIGAKVASIAIAVGIPLTALISFFLVPVIYLGLISLFGGKTKYMKLVAVYSLACIPYYVGSLITLGFSYYTNNYESLIKPQLMDVLLGRIDLFVIWQILLLIFGFSKVANLKLGKSAVVVSILWGLSTGISVVSLLLSGSR